MPNIKYTSQGLLAAGLAVAALSLTIMAQPSTARAQTKEKIKRRSNSE